MKKNNLILITIFSVLFTACGSNDTTEQIEENASSVFAEHLEDNNTPTTNEEKIVPSIDSENNNTTESTISDPDVTSVFEKMEGYYIIKYDISEEAKTDPNYYERDFSEVEISKNNGQYPESVKWYFSGTDYYPLTDENVYMFTENSITFKEEMDMGGTPFTYLIMLEKNDDGSLSVYNGDSLESIKNSKSVYVIDNDY